jgi:molybdopterin adenylyltransferase
MERSLNIVSVNISKEKGTIKTPCEKIELTLKGIESDAHSGDWHRQVSLLSTESIESFSLISGREYLPGEFAENITLSGMRLNECRPGDIIEGGTVTLLVTQIGKKCHGGGCAVFRESGACVMPKDGIFAKVLSSGELKRGDTLTYKPKLFRIGVITLSTRASQGVYPDRSGPKIISLLEEYSKESKREIETDYRLIPDNRELLTALIKEFIQNSYDFIFTTGGTGVAPSDFTPDVIKPMLDIEIPGVMEHIRVKYGATMPAALLSRGVAGVKDSTSIFTLPGSQNAVNEYMMEITPLMEHLFFMRMGLDTH